MADIKGGSMTFTPEEIKAIKASIAHWKKDIQIPKRKRGEYDYCNRESE